MRAQFVLKTFAFCNQRCDNPCLRSVFCFARNFADFSYVLGNVEEQKRLPMRIFVNFFMCIM